MSMYDMGGKIYCNLFHTKDDAYCSLFKKGIKAACLDFRLECIVTVVPKDDIAYRDCIKHTKSPCIVRYSAKILELMQRRSCVVIKGPFIPGMCSIPYLYKDMVQQLVTKSNDTISSSTGVFVVQDELEDPPIALENTTTVKTLKRDIVNDILSSLRTPNDTIKTLIVTNPNLLDSHTTLILKNMFPGVLLYTIGYKDTNVDYWVDQSPEEQGYLAVALTQRCTSVPIQTRISTPGS